ncbi:hypothetical protein CGN00_17785 [Salmonella enterica]|nr:hypothetical protein [Salmonella enterica]EAM3109832.1 hypothetical protein [Salmonella enterica]EAM3235053.1 hypothetical protein [Salmonella enterica]EAS2276327.1 hypothetical protein [Salmonella enterica]EAZ8978781.1 hypothetical protein [Salmonella enterica]
MSNSALQKSEDSWYDIVRRSDGCVVFSFPSSGRHLIYRVNGMVSMKYLVNTGVTLSFADGSRYEITKGSRRSFGRQPHSGNYHQRSRHR